MGESLNEALYILRFTTLSVTEKTPFELHFGRKPGSKLSKMKNVVSVDSKDLSVYITRNSLEEITDHLMMSEKSTTDLKYWRGMTFTLNKRPTSTVSMEKNTNYPFTFFEKAHKRPSLGSKFVTKLRIGVSGTKHTVTTNKNKVLHRQLFFNSLPFESTVTPIERINTRTVTIADKQSCSKSNEPTMCRYQKKEYPRPPRAEQIG